MSKQILMVVAAVAAFSFAISSDSANAQGAFGFPAGESACSTGACGTGGAISHGGLGAGRHQFSQRLQATQAQNDKIYARNAAWPKPFACASRQQYHNMWRPMIDAGWEDQCLLTSVHFDQSGELTRYGRNQISSMMMNMPRSRRIIYIQELANNADTDARTAKVQNVIQNWFAQRGGTVQVSSRTAVTMSGVRAVTITEGSLGAAPAPVIPVADGQSGVSSSVTQ